MGLSGSKSTTTSGPSKEALPYLQQGSNAIQGAYNSVQPVANQIGSTLADAFTSFNQSRQNNPNLNAANSYIGDVLGGKYLEGNPQLDNIIGQTNDSITDRVNAIFSRSGQTGSSRQIGELGKQLSDNESRLRYQNYTDEQTRIGQAIAQAMAMRQGDNQDMATLLALGAGATEIPMNAASRYAGGLGSLWGNSQTTTQSSGGNILGSLLNAGASIGSAAIMASDRRLKTDIEQVAALDDGLGVYRYRYITPPNEALAALMPQSKGGDPYLGVMADEVAELRPWALGPTVEGYQTVDYGRL
ncbi:hypothetical protein M2336_001662 [Sphingobium sp. B1D7B]|uniref:tail fiber domain-containing protein n=1 Tax=Sphingobium sp. B1D7B TaxID=2940578 RepID=UPI00222426BA|nr:tail fiber domain-containing protein [Sphingobium sp. B1D7B]MCW2405033.1 hypothetical protein [Sphingobium sp. B1D7B]